ELGLFAKFVDKELLDRLDFVLERPFQRTTYTEAIELLKKSGQKFEFPIEYGLNLQSEHERWLTEKHFKCPVTVFNYPKEIKPFYMRSEEHTSELQSHLNLVCRLLLEQKKQNQQTYETQYSPSR